MVKPTKYKIRVGDKSGHAFNSWALSSKTNDEQEVILDEVSHSADISDSHPEIVRNINCNEFLQSIKLMMNETNTNGDYQMILQNIEIYGFINYL